MVRRWGCRMGAAAPSDGVAMSLSGGPTRSSLAAHRPDGQHSQRTGHCQERSYRASPNGVRLVRCQAVVLQDFISDPVVTQFDEACIDQHP
jgi:hypothetical protein